MNVEHMFGQEGFPQGLVPAAHGVQGDESQHSHWPSRALKRVFPFFFHQLYGLEGRADFLQLKHSAMKESMR